MNQRLTWGMAKNLVGRPIGMGGDHPDLLPLVNEACEELWNAGDWIGKFQIYKISITEDCRGNRLITWPRQIETIEAIQHCGVPIGVRNQAFEFIENALGSFDTLRNPVGWYGFNAFTWRNQRLLGDRAEVCTFVDIQPGGKKVKITNLLQADDDVIVTILGYDDNGNWIRTKSGSEWIDGERLTCSADSPPTSDNFYSVVTGVQFSTTPRAGDIVLTQVDTTSANSECWLSTYAYDEELPVYRRSVLTGIPNVPQCPTVTAYVRMRYMPIRFDSDYMQISNIAAIKEKLLAIQKRDNDKLQDAAIYEGRAERSLNNELKQYKGVAPKRIISMQRRALWGSSSNVM